MTKMLDKVSKLLAKAENAGTPEEAETFMAKVQELATTNGIDLAVARLHQASKERVQVPEERSMQCNPRDRRHNRKHFIELGMAIADVNDVEYLIGVGDRTLHMVGFPSDLDMVEALFTHLSIQMVLECDEALKRGENKTEKAVLVTTKQPIAWEDRQWGDWNGKQVYDDDPDDDVYRHHNESDTDYEKRIAENRAEYEKNISEGQMIYSSQARNWQGGYRKPVPPPATRDVPVLDAEGNNQFETKTVSAVDGRVFRSHFYDLMSLFSELVAQHPRPVKIMEGEREDWRADMVQITVQLCEWDRAVRVAERDRMTSALVDLKERGL